ncbi:MAG: AAA domain-containing protein, partial [Opitutales bacterium]
TEVEKQHRDYHLQTDVPEEVFARTLMRIVKRRLMFEREKGLITFFLGIGFLEWTRKKPNSEDFYQFNSPVLLLPLTLDYNGAKAILTQSGGDLRLNEDLIFAVQEVTGVPPPPLPISEGEEEGSFDLDAYLDEIDRFIREKGRPEWLLRRRMAGGIFRSTGIPPSELIPERFSEEAIVRLGNWVVGEDGAQERLPLREVDAEKYRELAPAFALPADSSQHSAVIDVASGMNLVIEGPPGTGKSQSIVNLIANAMYHGKKVIFLAQKTAALEVVRHRLEKIGLGSKCLALHSGHASKAALFEEVGKRIVVEPEVKSAEGEFKRLCERRDECISKLNRYSALLGLKLRPGGEEPAEGDDLFTAHEAVVGHGLLVEMPDHLKDPLILPERVTKGLLEDARITCDRVSELAGKLDSDLPGKLGFFRRTRAFSPFDLDEFAALAENGISTLAPLGGRYATTSLPELDAELDGLRAVHEQRVKLDAIEAALAKDYRNTEDLAPKAIEDLVATLWRGSGFSAWFISSIREAKKAMLELATKPSPSFGELRKLGEALQKLLEERTTSLDLIKETQFEHLSTTELVEQIDATANASTHMKEVIESLGGGDFVIDETLTAETLRANLQLLIQHKSKLSDLCSFNGQLAELNETFGCDRFARTALAEGFPLADVFAKRFLRELCRALCRQEPDFLEFRGERVESLREELGQLMKEVRSSYCQLIASMTPDPQAIHSVNARRVGDKRGLALLRHVGEKTKARVTARELIFRAGEALNEFCPCFLMTPSSVADYLPPEHTFDLLLIDEASQMLVEEAAGSVLRSKQLVVVGDRQQMPPTRYMVSTLEVPDDEDKDESILERSSLALSSKRRLLYHYRSEDEALIAFSNHEFYDGELLTIPNLRKDPTMGVHLERAGGVYESGKGGSSRNPNPIEAERVVELIIEHAQRFPDRSLGVAVLNLRQAIRIEDLFDERVAQDPSLLEFLNRWQGTPEYFFIKNLENVQGDERDVILIATVFGRNSEGKVYQRFGPISQGQGENRINVLITRAKKRLIVCTSLEPNDISLQKEGPQVLSRYLSYAATGDIPTASIDAKAGIASPWGHWLSDRLEADGYEVDLRVGVSGWRLNLGVKHPERKGDYLCGIELDGDTYHDAPGARDRDVQRQAILEAKGWNIQRLWSVDFFHDPESEYARLRHAIEELLAKADSASEGDSASDEDVAPLDDAEVPKDDTAPEDDSVSKDIPDS